MINLMLFCLFFIISFIVEYFIVDFISFIIDNIDYKTEKNNKQVI